MLSKWGIVDISFSMRQVLPSRAIDTYFFAFSVRGGFLLQIFFDNVFGLKRVLPRWQRAYFDLILCRRFSYVWMPSLVASMTILLGWSSSKMDSASYVRAAETAAFALHRMMVPFSEHFSDGTLTSGAVEALRSDVGMNAKILGVKNVKVWDRDGRMVFAVDQAPTEQTFPLWRPLSDSGASGRSVALTAITDAVAGAGVSYKVGNRNEIYVPIREAEGGKVVAVVEFHPEAALLEANRSSTFPQIWTVAGMAFLALVSGLYCMMAQADRMIDRLRRDIGRQDTEIGTRLAANGSEDLDPRDSASTAEFNESLLRRIGADMHDGIGQLLTVAMLRLDRLSMKNKDQGEVKSIRSILDEALTEVREVCVGLSMPHIDDLPIAEAVRTMVLRYERRTSTQVRLTMDKGLIEPGPTVKIAICRLIQEGLNNAFKHAQGQGQSVRVRTAGPMLVVTVSDTGPGLPGPGQSVAQRLSVTGMGLVGLGARVKSVGGAITISGASEKASGTTLQGEFPVF